MKLACFNRVLNVILTVLAEIYVLRDNRRRFQCGNPKIHIVIPRWFEFQNEYSFCIYIVDSFFLTFSTFLAHDKEFDFANFLIFACIEIIAYSIIFFAQKTWYKW